MLVQQLYAIEPAPGGWRVTINGLAAEPRMMSEEGALAGAHRRARATAAAWRRYGYSNVTVSEDGLTVTAERPEKERVVQVNLRLPEDLLAKVRRQAAEDGVSVNKFIVAKLQED
jgi:hypothetical protein